MNGEVCYRRRVEVLDLLELISDLALDTLADDASGDDVRKCVIIEMATELDRNVLGTMILHGVADAVALRELIVARVVAAMAARRKA